MIPVLNVISGEGGVDFTGGATLGYCPNYLIEKTSAEIFMVLRAATDPNAGANNLWDMGQADSSTAYPDATGHIIDDWGSTTSHDLGDPAQPLTQLALYNVRSTPSEWTAYLDNVQLFTTPTNTVKFPEELRIGGGIIVSEIAIYSPALSETDRLKVANAIGARHGLSWATAPAGGGVTQPGTDPDDDLNSRVPPVPPPTTSALRPFGISLFREDWSHFGEAPFNAYDTTFSTPSELMDWLSKSQNPTPISIEPVSTVWMGISANTGFFTEAAYVTQVNTHMNNLGGGLIRSSPDGVGGASVGAPFTFTARDATYASHVAAGLKIHAVISAVAHVNHGANLAAWQANFRYFVAGVMQRYASTVKYYIIDNEPDLPAAGGVTAQQMVDFTQIAYEEAQIAAPDGSILIESPPTSGAGVTYLQTMLNLGITRYCAYVGVHAYGSGILDEHPSGIKRPWDFMAASGYPIRPVANSENGVTPEWAPSGVDPALWQARWFRLNYIQHKRYGYDHVLLYNLARGSGNDFWDFTTWNGTSLTPKQPVYDAIKAGYQSRPFANGGFEDANNIETEWAIYWNDEGVGATPVEWSRVAFVRGDAGNAHSGTGYMKFTSTAPNRVRRVVEQLIPGAPYTLSAWVRITGGGTATLKAQGYNHLNGLQEQSASTTVLNTWTKLSVSFTPTKTWVVIGLEGSGTGTSMFWDDVAMSTSVTVAAPLGSTEAFIETIGTNVHMGYIGTVYDDLTGSLNAKVNALGIRHFRDGAPFTTDLAFNNTIYARMRSLSTSTGVKWQLIVSPFNYTQGGTNNFTSVPHLQTVWDQTGVNVLSAIEGLNEFDASGRPNWIVEDRQWQQTLFHASNAISGLNALPVVGPTITTCQAATDLGDLSAYMDYGNMHPYPGEGTPENSIAVNIPCQRPMWGNKANFPVMATESGYQMIPGAWFPGVSELAAAKLMPRLYLANAKAGWTRTFQYELIDEDAGAPVQFGFLDNAGNERLTYTAMQNMIALLEDPGPSFTVTNLAYTLGNSSGVQSYLMQKRSGRWYLALWQDASPWNATTHANASNAAITVTLTTTSTMSAFNVYRPRTGAGTIQSGSGTVIAIPVPDEVIIVEIIP